MNPIKGMAAAIGLSLGATAVGIGTHFLSSANDLTVEGKLSWERNKFLNFDDSKDEEYVDEHERHSGIGSYSWWQIRVNQYKDEENTKEKFEGFELKNEDTGEQENIKALKRKCKETLASKGTKENIVLFENWCTKPKDFY